jgi:hypothetical protein
MLSASEWRRIWRALDGGARGYGGHRPFASNLPVPDGTNHRRRELASSALKLREPDGGRPVRLTVASWLWPLTGQRTPRCGLRHRRTRSQQGIATARCRDLPRTRAANCRGAIRC